MKVNKMSEVYKAINAVSFDIAQHGISKDKYNDGQKYKFRGVDDVLNTISPLLAKHKLIIIPRVLSRECVERASKSGGAMFYVNVDVEFDFISAIDGSKHTARMSGEAMDSADKATNKAMSAAYKYLAFLAFCIPLEGADDADLYTPEVLNKKEAEYKEKSDEIVKKIKSQNTLELLEGYRVIARPSVDALPLSYQAIIKRELATHIKYLNSPEAASLNDEKNFISNLTNPNEA
jgi:hypothetical protein